MATVEGLPRVRSAVPAVGGDGAKLDGGLEAFQDKLMEDVRALGYNPVKHPVHWKPRAAKDEPERPWANIVFDLQGTDRLAEVLLVGAHFDAVPGSPGADDNGSGVAALLEIARVLKDRKHHRTIRFVLFNLEEMGLVGSRQYVQANAAKWKAEGEERIVGMLSLEMLGYYDEKVGSQVNPFKGVKGLPQREMAGDFVALATVSRHASFCGALADAMHKAEPAAKTLRVDMFPVAPPDLLRSDHAPFLSAGIPAVMVTDTANFRNKNYHQPTDTAATLNPALFARTVRALAGAVHELAGPAEREAAPEWRPKPAEKPAPEPAPGEGTPK